jgi:hypothetical protein
MPNKVRFAKRILESMVLHPMEQVLFDSMFFVALLEYLEHHEVEGAAPELVPLPQIHLRHIRLLLLAHHNG